MWVKGVRGRKKAYRKRSKEGYKSGTMPPEGYHASLFIGNQQKILVFD